MQLEIPSCLGYGPQSLWLKRIWFSWLGGGLQKTSRKGLKQT